MKRCVECSEPVVRLQGRTNYCAKHYRYRQMRMSAKRYGKTVPSYEELHVMKGSDLMCPECGVQMHWLASVAGYRVVATLQHYRDGTFGIICAPCNSSDGNRAPGQTPLANRTQKLCSCCNGLKPLEAFSMHRRNSYEGRNSVCQKCSSAKHAEWVSKNREYVNNHNNEWRKKNASKELSCL